MSWFHRRPLSSKRSAGFFLVVLILAALQIQFGAQPLLPQAAPSATAATTSPTPDLSATATVSPTCAPAAPTGTVSPTPDLTTTGTASTTPDQAAATASPTPDFTTTPSSQNCAPSPTAGTPSPTSSQTTPTATTSLTPSPTQPSGSATAQNASATPAGLPDGTPAPGASPSPIAQAPAETPTVIPTPSDGVACAPDAEIIFVGEGPPGTALLLTFDQTIVGGGITNADQSFRIPLVIGERRAGYYPVTVEVRETREVLGRWTCIVPELTPTRTPARLP